MFQIKPKKELFLFIIFFIYISFFYFNTISINSRYDDTLQYLSAGITLVEDGMYTENYWLRPPLLPLIIASLYKLGVSVDIITLILPLFLIFLFILVSYYIINVFYNKELAYIVVLLMIVFPSLWRWGNVLLVDILFGALCLLSLLYFYLSVEKEDYYFLYSAFFLSLAFLTKISAIVIPFVFICFLIYQKKIVFIKSKYFLIGTFCATFIYLFIFLFIYSISSFEIFSFTPMNYALVAETTIRYFIEFLLSPIILLLPIGILRLSKSKSDILVSFLAIGFMLFYLKTTFLTRYFSILYPFMLLVSYKGYQWIINYFKINIKISKFIFLIILLISFENTVYLLTIDSQSYYGVYDLKEYISTLNTNPIIAVGESYTYLSIYTNNNLIQPPHYMVFGDKITMEYKEYIDLITNPDSENYSDYVNLIRSGNTKSFYDISQEWIYKNNISYIILSIYDEYEAKPKPEYYTVKYAGIEIPYKRQYQANNIPPNYIFNSEQYHFFENNNNSIRIKTIYKKNQEIFIIYKILF
ncbi:MAG: glycosyltransferase family 39 protein [DPANN group archaeon]|nr:glycosyltransferase family 39 protein [DPANN group archaeon]